jgi:threonine dehydrogenase-like Zn-dependent dehydrogenase
VLKSQGCRQLHLADTNPLRRETAARAGCGAVFDPRAGGGPADDGCDLVIDAVGGAVTRAAAMAAVRPGGVVVHVGLMDSAGPLDLRKLTLQEVMLVGCYTYTELDLRRALALLHEGALGPLDWIETRPLAEGAAAFRALDRGAVGAAKIVLQP